MGSINFVTSEYITLAHEPLELDFYLQNPCFLEWAENIVMSDMGGASLEDLAIEQIYKDYKLIRETAESIINDYDFDCYKISIVPGYEESYSIEIENCLQGHFDTYKDKQKAQKEVTRVKECLIRLVKEACFYECFPSWSTSYSDENESIQGINEAVKLMRKEIEITETERQWNKRKGRFI